MATINDPEIREGIEKRKKAKRKAKYAKPEEELAAQLDKTPLTYETQFKFHPTRKWRSDFHIKGYKLLVECNGMLSNTAIGGHNSFYGMTRDYEKNAEAMVLGYHTLMFSSQQVRSGYAMNCIMRVLGFGENKNWKGSR